MSDNIEKLEKHLKRMYKELKREAKILGCTVEQIRCMGGESPYIKLLELEVRIAELKKPSRCCCSSKPIGIITNKVETDAGIFLSGSFNTE